MPPRKPRSLSEPKHPQAPTPKLGPLRRPAYTAPDHRFDQLRGTDTGGLIPPRDLVTGHPADRHVTAYYGVAPSILRTLLELWQHRTTPPFTLDRYTFLDIGAGKGRAMLVAAENPFQQVLGVELNPDLAAIAEGNFAIAQSSAALRTGAPELLSSLRLLRGDALDIPLPETPTLLHLFHPFEAPLLRRLLGRVEAAFLTRPGQLDLLYVNAEHSSVLTRNPAFQLLWTGNVPMSTEDHIADLQEIATQLDYGSTGDEQCAIYRYTSRLTPRCDRG